jgi:hypothetical protein
MLYLCKQQTQEGKIVHISLPKEAQQACKLLFELAMDIKILPLKYVNAE